MLPIINAVYISSLLGTVPVVNAEFDAAQNAMDNQDVIWSSQDRIGNDLEAQMRSDGVIRSNYRVDEEQATNLDGQTTFLSPTYYLPGVVTAYSNSSKYNYYKVIQCPDSIKHFKQTKLSIINPDNIEWKTGGNKELIFVEVSKCAKTWNEDCIFALNYNMTDKSHPHMHSQIVWNNTVKLDDNTFYIRFMTDSDQAKFTFQIEYVNGNKIQNNTQFDSNQFNVKNVDTNVYKNVKQLIRGVDTYSISTNNGTDFFAILCDQGATGDLSVDSLTVTVTGTPDAPMSAFYLTVCGSTIDESQCTIRNVNKKCVAIDNSGAFVASTEFVPSSSEFVPSSSDCSLYNGIWIRVDAQGGYKSGYNSFLLTITTNYKQNTNKYHNLIKIFD